MRRRTKLAAAVGTAVVAAGLVGAGAVMTPAVLAAVGDGPGQRAGDRAGMFGGWMHEQRSGAGMGGGMGGRMHSGMGGGMHSGMGGGMHRGMGGGPCHLDPTAEPEGTLTQSQEQALAEQAEREKLSHDLYVAFFETTDDVRFERVAWSEERHLAALRVLLSRYDVEDPTEGQETGEFRSAAVQAAYDEYVDGVSDLDDALAAARAVERTDLAELRAAVDGLEAPDVERTYTHLTVASEHHLAVFGG